MNYFKVLCVKEEFDIDLNQLDVEYFKKMQSNEQSILNRGYQVLKDDLERALHLLEIYGVNLPNLSAQFLSDILDDFEKISQVPNFLELKLNIRKQIISSLKDAFKNSNYIFAAQKTMELKYLNKVIEYGYSRR